LADLAAVEILTIVRIEAGSRNILLATAERIRRALNVSWDELLKGS